MAELPFPITAKDTQSAILQMQLLMDELYEERIGGANLGDVFTVGDDDILTIQLSSTGGLYKTSSQMSIKLDGSSLSLSADGLKLTGAPQAHEADAETAHAITDPADAPADADALRDDLVANAIPEVEAALNALGTKVNNILAKIETLGLFETS